jgi:hypothetical protein
MYERGASLSESIEIIIQIEEYIHPENVLQPFSRIEPNHSRFGNVEKIRTKKSDVYKLIMATKDVKLQTVSIDCRIL